MPSYPQAPFTLRDPEQVKARQQMLDLPHIQPLIQWLPTRIPPLTEKLQQEVQLPLFDPLSGGVNSQVLLLLGEPADLAAKISPFVSWDNPHPTARQVFTALRESELPREQALCWTVVPWLRESQHPPDRKELQAGTEELHDLLSLLPDVKVVVLHGSTARKGWDMLPAELQQKHRVFQVGHPEARNLRPQDRPGQLEVYREVFFRVQYPWIDLPR